MDKLAEEVLKLKEDGVIWKTEYKKEPIAFGVHKLCIGCVIEDEKVSTDDLQEKLTGEVEGYEHFKEYVQSCDVAVFSKI